MAAFRLLIFDLDGTLVDSQYDLTAAVNYVRVRYNEAALDVATVRAYVGNGVSVLMQRAIPGLSAAELARATGDFRAYYYEHLLDTTKLYPDVRKLLNRLPGCIKTVLTNKPEAHAKKIISDMGVGEYFAIIWGGDSGPQRKPDPGPVLEIMRRMSCPPAETLVIGDGVNDILAAKAAGVRCAAVAYGYTPKAELLGLAPDYVIDQPLDLLKITREHTLQL